MRGYNFDVVERNRDWSFKAIWETPLYLASSFALAQDKLHL